MAKYHVFQATTGIGQAVTDDKSGSKLPKREYGGWKYARDLDISRDDGPRIGADSADIIAGVEKDGYFLWPQKP